MYTVDFFSSPLSALYMISYLSTSAIPNNPFGDLYSQQLPTLSYFNGLPSLSLSRSKYARWFAGPPSGPVPTFTGLSGVKPYLLLSVIFVSLRIGCMVGSAFSLQLSTFL